MLITIHVKDEKIKKNSIVQLNGVLLYSRDYAERRFEKKKEGDQREYGKIKVVVIKREEKRQKFLGEERGDQRKDGKRETLKKKL